MFNLLKTHSVLFPPQKMFDTVFHLPCYHLWTHFFASLKCIWFLSILRLSVLKPVTILLFFFSLWSPIFLLLPFCFLRQSLSSDPPTFTSGLLWQPSCLPCNRFRSLSLSLLTKTSVLVPVPLYITKRRLPLSQMSSWPEETEMVDAVVIVVGICPGWWSWLCP